MGNAPLPHNKRNCFPPYSDHYLKTDETICLKAHAIAQGTSPVNLLSLCCTFIALGCEGSEEADSCDYKTSGYQRLGIAFDDLDPSLSLLCQVGDDVIRHSKICGGCKIRLQDPIVHGNCPIQPRIQSVLGVRTFYVERTEYTIQSRSLMEP